MFDVNAITKRLARKRERGEKMIQSDAGNQLIGQHNGHRVKQPSNGHSSNWHIFVSFRKNYSIPIFLNPLLIVSINGENARLATKTCYGRKNQSQSIKNARVSH